MTADQIEQLVALVEQDPLGAEATPELRAGLDCAAAHWDRPTRDAFVAAWAIVVPGAVTDATRERINQIVNAN